MAPRLRTLVVGLGLLVAAAGCSLLVNPDQIRPGADGGAGGGAGDGGGDDAGTDGGAGDAGDGGGDDAGTDGGPPTYQRPARLEFVVVTAAAARVPAAADGGHGLSVIVVTPAFDASRDGGAHGASVAPLAGP